jgi:hypothetical protein
MASTAVAQREIIRFQPGQVETVVLKYANGREVNGANGPQFMFTTADNRIFFLDPDIAYNVEKCATEAGQGVPLTIVKTKGPRNTVNWDVRPAYRSQAASASPTPAPAFHQVSQATTSAPTSLEQALTASIAHVEAKKAAAEATPRAMALEAPAMPEYLGNLLAECGIAALNATAKVEEHAGEIGFELQFDQGAIERMAVTLFIETCKRGAR